MELPVVLNGTIKTARTKFADKTDLAFVTEWRLKLGNDSNPLRIDAVDFAQLAVSRVESYSSFVPYASTIDDIGDHIQSNPRSEIAALVLLECGWFPDSKVISICHFRRTWSNRIILDYLASHPFITRPPTGFAHVVKGAGRALLYFVSMIAKRYNCDAIWGEATQGSCEYYKKAFGLDSVKDLIYIPKDNYVRFGQAFDEGAIKGDATSSGGNTASVLTLETHSPPFVGSKTAVFNPVRRLARHFLDLPHHVRIAIGRELSLASEDDASQSADELFRLFFRRASEKRKLPDFWYAVEQQHPLGEPDKNPFPKSFAAE